MEEVLVYGGLDEICKTYYQVGFTAQMGFLNG